MAFESVPPGVGTIPQRVIFGIIVALWLVVMPFGIFIFWKRRHLHPIKGRFNFIAILSQFFLGAWVITGCFTINLTPHRIPCYVRPIVGLLFLACLACYYIRTQTLYLSFKVTTARVLTVRDTKNDYSKDLKKSKYIKFSFMVKLFIGLFLFHSLCILLIAVHAASSDETCVRSSTEVHYVLIMSIYAISYIYFGVQLRQYGNDGFGIKTELGWVAVTFACGIIGWFLVLRIPAAVEADTNKFKFSALIPYLFTFGTFIGTILVPLRLSYEHESDEFKRKSAAEESRTRDRGPLGRYLVTEEGKEAFREFLASEFSVENLSFYEAVEAYRSQQFPGDIHSQAVQIVEMYINPEAPLMINASATNFEKLFENLGLDPEVMSSGYSQGSAFASKKKRREMPVYSKGKKPPISVVSELTSAKNQQGDISHNKGKLLAVFDPIQNEIYALMESDSFSRFKRSEIYRKHQDQILQYV